MTTRGRAQRRSHHGGFRRSQTIAYRPACEACRGLRVRARDGRRVHALAPTLKRLAKRTTATSSATVAANQATSEQ